MIYEYIINNYSKDEPIFLSELPGNSKAYLRQEMKKLVDDGKLVRLYNGVYFISYTTILGTKGKISINKFIEKKFLTMDGEPIGYITGFKLANMYGFTTQNPSCIEVCSNEATTKQRSLEIDGQKIIVYKPVAKVTGKNKSALQFLDLILNVEKYSEIKGDILNKKLYDYIKHVNVDFNVVKELIGLYPDKVYRNIYNGGLMCELV